MSFVYLEQRKGLLEKSWQRFRRNGRARGRFTTLVALGQPRVVVLKHNQHAFREGNAGRVVSPGLQIGAPSFLLGTSTS